MEESINKQLSRLLGEIKKGHAKALGGIQLLLESRLSKVISGFFLQEADREDILEDTYLRIVLEIHTYKRDENPSAWIIRILKSIIFTKLKKQKREVSMEDARLERRGMSCHPHQNIQGFAKIFANPCFLCCFMYNYKTEFKLIR